MENITTGRAIFTALVLGGLTYANGQQLGCPDPKPHCKYGVLVAPSGTMSCAPWGYILVLEDEFDNGSVPNVDYWYNPTGGNPLNDWSDLPYPETVNQNNGVLTLKTKPAPIVSANNGKPYIGSEVTSRAFFGPGRFEINCQLPYNAYYNTAFWLYGACSQEFDGFEHGANLALGMLAINKSVREYTTLHGAWTENCVDNDKCFQVFQDQNYDFDHYNSYHKFVMEWEPDFLAVWRDAIDNNHVIAAKFWSLGLVNPASCSIGYTPDYPLVCQHNGVEAENPYGDYYWLDLNFPKPNYGMQFIMDSMTDHDWVNDPYIYGSFADFQYDYKIDYVKIWQRADCGGDRGWAVSFDFVAGGLNGTPPSAQHGTNVTVGRKISFGDTALDSASQSFHFVDTRNDANNYYYDNTLLAVASTEIEMLNGFYVDEGAFFKAAISPCETNPALRASPASTGIGDLITEVFKPIEFVDRSSSDLGNSHRTGGLKREKRPPPRPPR